MQRPGQQLPYSGPEGGAGAGGWSNGQGHTGRPHRCPAGSGLVQGRRVGGPQLTRTSRSRAAPAHLNLM